MSGDELLIALKESLKLQSHYAVLLNAYDGGKRVAFDSLDRWIERLKETGTIPRGPKLKEIRLVVRCTAQPDTHAKVLVFGPSMTREYVETMAGLLDGSSDFYIYKPGPDSTIGKCATCGAQLTTEIEERVEEE